MFVKRVRKTNGKTKKRYQYLHLVESVRTERGPRQRLILNLGDLDIAPSQYQAFAKRVEDILTGQQSFVTLEPFLEKHASNTARKIFKKQAQELSEAREVDFENVDTSSLGVEFPRSLGPEYLCHSVWNELKMDRFFAEQEVSPKVVPLLEALIVGRLVAAGSERYTKE